MRGELKEYVMPDGKTYQFWECDAPAEAKLMDTPKAIKPAASKPSSKATASKKADK